MAQPVPWLAASTLRNLADKLYERRKAAALEVEQATKSLAAAGDLISVGALIDFLVDEYALSPQANHRKGGLIGLAAATVGLSSEHDMFLKKIVPPVLHSFQDQDSRVRYYACEALYNISKVARGGVVPFFNDTFDALCKLSADSDPNVQNAAHLLDRLVKDIVTESTSFSVEAFIPLLRERLTVLNPYVRQFLVGWITVLDSVPDIDMLEFLPDFLDGLLNMLSDPNREIRQQADTALAEFLHEVKSASFIDYKRLTEILVSRASSPDEFTRLTAITWLHEFVELGKTRMVPYAADILGAILPCLSHSEERVAAVAARTNDALLALNPSGAGFDLRAVLAVLEHEVSEGREPTRLAALKWVSVLLVSSRLEVLASQGDLGQALLESLRDTSDQVVLQALDVQASLSREDPHFRILMERLLHQFSSHPALLESRGSLTVRRLCVLLGAERVFRELAALLAAEADCQFSAVMVQALNLILLTAAETGELRASLKRSAVAEGGGAALFLALLPSWCHSAVATVSLCLLAQAYSQACRVVCSLGDVETTVDLLVEVDQLVQLLETPVFTSLRLQLLVPSQHPSLLKTLHGMLLLLPVQSSAWVTLSARLQCVPTLHQLELAPSPPEESSQQPSPAELAAMFEAAAAKRRPSDRAGDGKS